MTSQTSKWSPSRWQQSRDRDSARCSSARFFDVAQTRCFALEAAQIIKLGAADFGRAQQIHFVDHFGVNGENAFHALSEADLPDGKAGLRSVVALDHHAFKGLHALFVAFFDLHMHANGVSRMERG